ncbi:hypothetical protein DFH08DRAFT_1044891 [Mycena albidolilacea]|uniref:Meiotically up-regulated Mug190 protein third C2 domain-containing protein n=1 Tax=Mycena albidolilacea TaxID=1033008 RepID=A0AAD6Z8B4_9AGAR|nr:hypothetical protein DFH08DRAFT_1044891 [Mycena albidolilacea]
MRNSCQHETDPLIGVVVLPLKMVLQACSQINEAFPLIGGIRFGCIQLLLVFHGVQARLPKPLLGWDIDTLDIQPHARATGGTLPADLTAYRLVLCMVNAKGKMRAQPDGGWVQKRGKPMQLAVKRCFGKCLLVEFRKNSLGPDHTPAFGTLWLKDEADEEEAMVQVPVWRSGHGALECARVKVEQPGEGAERVGTLELTVKMWLGLSGYHKALVENDANLADMMQVLDAAEVGEGDSAHDSLYNGETSCTKSGSRDRGQVGVEC